MSEKKYTFEEAFTLIRDQLLDRGIKAGEEAASNFKAARNTNSPQLTVFGMQRLRWSEDFINAANRITSCWNDGDFDQYLEEPYLDPEIEKELLKPE